MTDPLEVLVVAGARPNFIKIASLVDALDAHPDRFAVSIVHTGQHYDETLSRVFFDELEIPRPDINLEVGSGSHARQTARIMTAFESVLEQRRPELVVVVGDVNSTVACALVATKLGVPVAHVEAGLRSFDRTMPEEINRVVTDAISDLLFVSEPSGMDNLAREGIPRERTHFVGNVMIDTLLKHRDRAAGSSILADLGLAGERYAVLTVHRPGNVDSAETFGRLVGAVVEIARDLPVIFPVHPRTLDRIRETGLRDGLESSRGLRTISPLGYLDFLALQSAAALVLTDSGGIQEETTALGVPCLTLRENTERPVTVTHGTNVLVGTDPGRIVSEATRALSGESKRPESPPQLWDGKAGHRIATILEQWRTRRA